MTRERRRIERGSAARRDANLALLNAAHRAGLTGDKDPMSIIREAEAKLKDVRTGYLLRALFAMRYGKWFLAKRCRLIRMLLPWRVLRYRKDMKKLGAELALEPNGKVVADQLGLRRWFPKRLRKESQ